MKKIDLVFLWHMHQPDYRDPVSGDFVLPWVYLHALKDYSDMAAHLERHPRIHSIINFVPVLLDQIADYCAQFDDGQFRDPLLRLLALPDHDQINQADRKLLLDTCFRCNHATMLAPFPHYKRLFELHSVAKREGVGGPEYFSGQYFADLVTWYHLTWCGESVRIASTLPAKLMRKGESFTAADRQELLALIGSVIRGLIPRYRNLCATRQIELSTTPGTHPLGPLLIDFGTARESEPHAPLPLSSGYPGGRERMQSQIADALAMHTRHFGAAPTGVWPAEGAISTALVKLLADNGCRWLASGERVLRNSLTESGIDCAQSPYRPWHLADTPGLTLFFRDEGLSDLIGFEYSRWHGRDAALHFIAQLDAIRAAPGGESSVVSVILDGENAWEHYPYNGYHFFEDLYTLLETSDSIQTTTYSELLQRTHPPAPSTLARLVAGSWVYGTMSTWIGDADKNRAWDLLCEAKRRYDEVLASGQLSPDEVGAAQAQLAVCESSDWFWWFGDYNPAAAVVSFDRLFRHNLACLYRRIGLNPPDQLAIPLSHGDEDATDGTMRRASNAVES